jgi:uncharacterized membrane protein
MRGLLVTIHVLAVAAWIGGGLFASVSLTSLAKTLGVKTVLSLDQAVGTLFFGAAVGTVALSGVALVLTSDSYGWGTAFVLVGLVVIVLDGALEGAVFGPRLKRLAGAAESGSTSEAGALAEYRRLSLVSTVVHLALVVFALWSMVVRLGL